jgi:alpha-L-rhamnosidase
VINCLGWLDFDLLARVAAELGLQADHDSYRARAEELKTAINGRLLNAAGVYVDGLYADGAPSPHVSQHANMLPLALGLVPPGHRSAVTAKVRELNMSVGMETVWWLLRALGEADEGEQLIALYTNASQPGWARSLARGATTTWESWFADEERNNSLSHGWGAIGLRGYTDYILGIKPRRPQFEAVQIKPLDFGSKLAAARGTVPTDRGPIAVDWRRERTRYRLSVTLPPNVTALVLVPAGGSGEIVRVDGVDVEGVRRGRYLEVAGIGSGTHVFERELDPRAERR